MRVALSQRIHREGPVPYSVFVGAALDEFFLHGGAGRAGSDFVTSPEVGPLFGALVARALDGWFVELGSPDPFIVVEGGAGRGRLAGDVLRAGPDCAPALRYVMVEKSATLRAEQRDRLTVEPWEDALGPYFASPDGDDDPEPVAGVGPIVTALDDLPALGFEGVILANELLDNLPFDVIERTAAGWFEIRVGLDGERFVEVPVPADTSVSPPFDAAGRESAPAATRDRRMARRLRLGAASGGRRRDRLRRPGGRGGRAGRSRLAADLPGPPSRRRPARSARHAGHHHRHRHRVAAPGRAPAGFTVALETTQAAWLAGLGIDDLVEAGRRRWDARAHLGDLEAVAGRSRVTEAAALTDPSGLGAHTVTILTRTLTHPKIGTDPRGERGAEGGGAVA